MSLDRRHLLTAACAAGLTAAAPKLASAAAAASAKAAAGDAALNRYFDTVNEHILSASPECATGLGLDPGKRAALKSRFADASMAFWKSGVVTDCPACERV